MLLKSGSWRCSLDNVKEELESKGRSSVFSWVITILSALLVGWLLRTFVFGIYFIPSSSMEETLMINDKILVAKYDKNLENGDLVVFNAEGAFAQPGDPGVFVKRVIAIPGDTVSCCEEGKVTVNSVPLEEDYLFEDDKVEFPELTMGEDEYFVMGDHRSQSSDSRYRGPISKDAIIGQVKLRIWPLSNFGGF